MFERNSKTIKFNASIQQYDRFRCIAGAHICGVFRSRYGGQWWVTVTTHIHGPGDVHKSQDIVLSVRITLRSTMRIADVFFYSIIFSVPLSFWVGTREHYMESFLHHVRGISILLLKELRFYYFDATANSPLLCDRITNMLAVRTRSQSVLERLPKFRCGVVDDEVKCVNECIPSVTEISLLLRRNAKRE